MNTIVSGVFLDQLSEPDLTIGRPLTYMGYVNFDPPGGLPKSRDPSGGKSSDGSLVELANSALFATSDPVSLPYSVLAYRYLDKSPEAAAYGPGWQWKLCLWNAAQRRQFSETMKLAYASFQELNEVAHRRSATITTTGH